MSNLDEVAGETAVDQDGTHTDEELPNVMLENSGNIHAGKRGEYYMKSIYIYIYM